MKRKFIVVDGNNNMSWSSKMDSGETFQTYEWAYKRAKELAESEPGTEVLICECTHIVTADVKPVTVRKV